MSETHAPVVVLAPAGGIRTFVACECGWAPKKAPQSVNGWNTGHMAHMRKLGLPRADYGSARYAPEVGL
jgi:hypothetical protein